MPAGIYNLKIEQGATFEIVLTIKQADGSPVDLSGYTALAQMREKVNSQVIAATFTITFLEPRAAGKIKMALTATQTALLAAKGYVYDLELQCGSTVDRLIAGKVVVDPEVSR